MWFCPSYHLSWVSPLPLDVEYLFLVRSNSLQLTVVQQWVIVFEFSQKMSTRPSTLPSKGRKNENNKQRKLTKLITWITALSNSVKLWASPGRAPKTDGSRWVVLTKRVTLEKGMASQFSVLALNSVKRQKDMTLKDELPRSVGA